MANLKRGTPKGKKAPQSKTRQSPRGRRNANRDPTPEQSSESEHEEQEQQEDQEEQSLSEQSNSEGSNDQSYDFLGRAPSNAVSESTVVSAADDNIGGASSTNQTPQRVSTRPSTQQPSTDGRKSRKQTQPKKRRKDRVTKELVKLQRTTKLLIPRLPFQRLVREIMQQFKNDFRMQTSSLECLQEAAECYLTQLFEDSYLCCLHRSRITLTEKDMRLVQILRGPLDAGRR